MVLHDELDNRNKKDLLIITGDINAKVGEENWDYDKLSGRSREGARGARSPIPPYFYNKLRPGGPKKVFLEIDPHSLSQGLDDRQPPPPSPPLPP